MKSQSNISVALCTYNGEKYLREQLESILSQKIPVNEIVVCDDCSTDETLSILNQYKEKLPALFKIYKNEENLGYVKNFEKAMSLCSGEIIFLSDQDDIWDAEKVQKITDFLFQNPQIGVVAHNLSVSAETETFWDLKKFRKIEKNFSPEKLLYHVLLHGNVFPGMSLAVRREVLNQYLPLKKINSIIIHDYEIVIRSLRDQNFGIVDEVLGFYRQHHSQSIGYKSKSPINTDPLTEIHLLSQQFLRLKKYVAEFNLAENMVSDFQKEINVKYSLFLKQFPLAKRIFIQLKNKYYYKIIHF